MHPAMAFFGSKRVRRALKWSAAAVLAVPLAMVVWAAALQVSGNVAVVEPGAVYRSAQLSNAQLVSVMDKYKIRTIVNLRGARPGRKWYDDEIAVAAAAGVRHIDIEMSASNEPDDATVRQLLAAFTVSPGAILLHCRSGSDRSGFAAAIYEAKVLGWPPAIAARQLSFRYGHFPWLGSETSAMDRAFLKSVSPAPN